MDDNNWNPTGDEWTNEHPSDQPGASKAAPASSAPPPRDYMPGGGNDGEVTAAVMGNKAGNDGLYQSEQGLTTSEPKTFPDIKTYDQSHSGPSQKFDFSKLPPGAAGSTEALSQLLGRQATPVEAARARAFLDTIAYSEGTSVIGYKANGGQGYDVMVGGAIIGDLSKHPGTVVQLNSTLASSAAGRYQILKGTSDECASAMNLKNFSAVSQDASALYLLKRSGALEDVVAGNTASAIQKSSKTWASFPGAGYGQNEHDMATLQAAYDKAFVRQQAADTTVVASKDVTASPTKSDVGALKLWTAEQMPFKKTATASPTSAPPAADVQHFAQVGSGIKGQQPTV